ncbi:MAG: hypothetical protein JWR07_736 [Nevskia sp.]|nr:hypothetical protein [Nevskia sp.]
MPPPIQKAVLDLVLKVTGGSIETARPDWLMQPGKAVSAKRWPLLRAMYHDLTGQDLPDVLPANNWRGLDGLKLAGSAPRVIEVDEAPHFNNYRGMTLRRYPANWPLAFDIKVWIRKAHDEPKPSGGGAKPVPLFPGDSGRHTQRAFRDALADILPLDHGYLPTLRIADFEVKGWVGTVHAQKRMEELLQDKQVF